MADKNLTSGITAADPLDGTELIHGVQGGNSRKLTAEQVANAGDGWVIAQVVTISADTTIEFTDLDPDLEHEFTLENVVPSVDGATPQLRVSVDNGMNWLSTAIYERAIRVHNASGANTDVGQTGQTLITMGGSAGTGTGETYNIRVRFPNIGSSLYKVTEVHGRSYISSGAFQAITGGYAVATTSAVDGVQFLISSGNYASGTAIHRTRKKA